ncbi:TPA: KilA-N domain-containing protein [Citrobacter freundii]|uniref:KilA-N domain-containing protein n=1 Tax=Citrobacter freundii TaxID=546 RepID=UPI0015EAFFC2|nr:KilA-N domain-containing protein [Citrobacter freundii]MDE8795721.1 KilA-N domain-containing protein [Citrobacter freundii]QLU14070.1 KilA-N domain-containing protein [Citrobacter freundii]HCB1820666.1 KilA-N domain-containing protein [Citrobacter freundii]HEE9834684.1 KilA-N domain-containing protein [Citrobacter freundii]HEE9896497.1 KilA-N domain-containing protein [Citrobacter freundii]
MNMQFYRRPINTAAFNYQASKQAYQINHARKRETLPAVPEQSKAHKLMLEVMGQPIRNRGELFSANDLHKIAGGDPTKRPAEWLRNKQTQELIEELSQAGIPARNIYSVSQRGSNPGTWLCEDLMYEYAAWLSPRFRLMMIHCFKAYAQAMIDRAKLRGESKELTDTLMITRREIGKETKFYHYANEHKLINKVLLGMPMDKFMKERNIPKDCLRDYLTPAQIARLDKLISYDMTLINLDYSYAEREAELIKLNDRLLARERQALPSKSE